MTVSRRHFLRGINEASWSYGRTAIQSQHWRFSGWLRRCRRTFIYTIIHSHRATCCFIQFRGLDRQDGCNEGQTEAYGRVGVEAIYINGIYTEYVVVHGEGAGQEKGVEGGCRQR